MFPFMLEGVTALLIDLDGVLYVEEDRVPGSLDALQRLRDGGLALRFVTNTTAHSRARTLEKLTRLGFAVAERELVTPKNRYWLRADGLSLDVGPFVAAIGFATGTEAYVVGKPAHAFFAEVLAELEAPPAATAMIGDDIESDIGGALRAGLAAILVRTGKYREQQVPRPRT